MSRAVFGCFWTFVGQPHTADDQCGSGKKRWCQWFIEDQVCKYDCPDGYEINEQARFDGSDFLEPLIVPYETDDRSEDAHVKNT